jgi:CheY-like chemotaxis protein
LGFGLGLSRENGAVLRFFLRSAFSSSFRSHYQMPSMDGVEVARTIKADPKLSETFVVLLTTVSRLIEVRHQEIGTIDASLVKPVRQSQLLNTISTAWSRKHQPSIPIDVRLDRPVEEMRRALAVRC